MLVFCPLHFSFLIDCRRLRWLYTGYTGQNACACVRACVCVCGGWGVGVGVSACVIIAYCNVFAVIIITTVRGEGDDNSVQQNFIVK